MRKIVLVIFVFVLSALGVLNSRLASAANTAAAAAKPAPDAATITLTPEQARAALTVLNDPARRSQIEDTLRAVVAAGALATPVQAASGSSAATASAASGASGAASVLAKSLTSNGLASQISHEAGSWIMELSSDLRRSGMALLDYGSVMQWWQQRAATTSGRELIGQVIWSISIKIGRAHV